MIKKIIFISTVLFSYTILAQATISKNLETFTSIKINNGIEVEIIKSTTNKVVISGEKSEIVKVAILDDVLQLSLPFSVKPAENDANGMVQVKLYCANTIQFIDANQGSTITGVNFNQEKLEVSAKERAYIELTAKVTTLVVKTTSGGIIKLIGSAVNQDVDADLYGVYNGFEMKITENSIVNAGTGARAEILAGNTLNAKVAFGGSIFYKGNPQVTEDKKVIGGIIKKRN